MAQNSVFRNALLLALLAILAWLSFLIVKPFVTALVFGSIFAYMLNPVHKRLEKLVGARASASIICVMLILIIGVPVVLLVNSLVGEVDYLYVKVKQGFDVKGFIAKGCLQGEERAMCKLVERFEELIENPEVKRTAEDITKRTLLWLSQQVSKFIIGIPLFILSVLVTIASSYYLLLNGSELVLHLRAIVPAKPQHKQELIRRINGVLFGVLYGALLIALIEGIFGAIGFVIFGLPAPVFWGFVIMVLAILPMVGVGLVYIPAGLSILIPGIVSGDAAMVFKGAAFLAYCAIFISGADYLLRPIIIGTRSRINPLLALLGVLGGIPAFGIAGFVLGPLVLSLLQTCFDMYIHELQIFRGEKG